MTDQSVNFIDFTDFAELVDQMAKFLALPIAPDYRPGVIANLERSATIAQLVLEFPIPDHIQAAPTFQP